MATFAAQVKALTSISTSGSTVPTTAEVSQFLIDGVLDVTKNTIAVRPHEKELFMTESDPLTSNAQSISSSTIIKVVREDGTINQWMPCRKISPDMEHLTANSGSIHYASKNDPSYFVDVNSTVNVFPAPSTSGDRFKVYYVNESPKGDGTSDTLAGGHSTIGYFPNDRVHLVVIYAAIKVIDAKLASYTVDDEDVELVQSLQVALATLKDDYAKGFSS